MTTTNLSNDPRGPDPLRRRAPAAAEPASAASRQDALLDQAIEETFPASDPISPMLVS